MMIIVYNFNMNTAILKNALKVFLIMLLLHTFLTYFSLYWIYSWSDMIVHGLLGVFLGLLFISFVNVRKILLWNLHGSTRRLSMVMFVAVVAVLWEFVERGLGLAAAFGQSIYDAQSDVWAALVGSFFAYVFIYVKYKKNERK